MEENEAVQDAIFKCDFSFPPAINILTRGRGI